VRLYILSGAGLSAPSGIPTFRDGGLWDRYKVEEICSAEAVAKDLAKVNRFYDERRRELAKVEPNEAHRYFAQLESRYETIHLTQNVDDLLERAGADPIHLHGRLTQARCMECAEVFKIGYEPIADRSCPKCDAALRPDVVMFAEVAPDYRYLYTIQADIFIAVGTSGRVIDIADIAQKYPISILINPKREKRVTMFGEFDEYVDEYFTHFIQKDVTKAISDLEDLLREAL